MGLTVRDLWVAGRHVRGDPPALRMAHDGLFGELLHGAGAYLHDLLFFETYCERYVKGDVTMSLIQTARGRVIHLVHGVSNPHPRSRLNHLAGTKGVFEDYPPRIYLEPAQSDDYAAYDHWLWTEVGPVPGGARRRGLHQVVAPRADAAPRPASGHRLGGWNAPFPLSVQSVRRGRPARRVP